MGSGKRAPNSKAVAAREKKAETEAKRASEEAKKREAAEAAEWSKGANSRRAAKDEAAALKADEAARKRREKQELLAAEEEAAGGGGAVRKGPTVAMKKNNAKKKKAKNDLALLEESLQKSADKKVRKKREDEMEKKRREEQQKREKLAKQAEASASVDPMMANTQQMIGDIGDGDGGIDGGRNANLARAEMGGGSGIDAALQSLSVTSGGDGSSAAMIKSAKALYMEFEERTLPQVKSEYPGLRLSQYKEKVWQLWKKSPENPANQQLPDKNAK